MWRAVVLILAAGTASAQPVRLDVTTDACPNLADDLDHVGEFTRDARASVRVEEHERTATITLDNGDGRSFGARVIHAETCDALATSLAVVVAMVLPAIAELSPPPPPLSLSVPDPQPDPVDLPVPAVVPELATTRHVEVTPSHHRAVELSAQARVSSDLGRELALGVRWRWNAVSLGGELAGALPEDIAQQHASVERVSAAVVPCDHAGAFAICGVVRAGFDRGAGQDLMNEQAALEPLVEVGSRLVWERALTEHLAVALTGEADVALTTSQLDVDHVAVWHSRRFEGLAGAGVVVRFP